VTNTGGLLKVMRDYKHFFKGRCYVMGGDNERIYSPDITEGAGLTEVWTYQYRWGKNQTEHIAASNQMQNDYVKWGARQITTAEFIRISTLYMARGLQRANGNSWNTGYWGRTGSASTSQGGSGSLYVESNFGVTSWDLSYNSYKDDLQTKAGDWMTFITISGKSWAGTGATDQYPQRYGDAGWFDIIGPWDTPNLYTGKMRIGYGDEDMYWSNASARIYVQYPSANTNVRHPRDNQTNGPLCERVPWLGYNTPLPYRGEGNERYQGEDWQ
jgi:hypothetical protein